MRNSSLIVLPNMWELFLGRSFLGSACYFQKTAVQYNSRFPKPLGNTTKSMRYQGYWIGLGDANYNNTRDGAINAPYEQFLENNNSTLPRVARSSHFKQLINDYNNCILEQQQFTPSIPNQIINRIAIIESLSQSMTNIKSILAQFNDNNNKVDIETTINLIINTTNESRLAAQQERMQLINDSISSSTSIDDALEEMQI